MANNFELDPNISPCTDCNQRFCRIMCKRCKHRTKLDEEIKKWAEEAKDSARKWWRTMREENYI